MSRRALTLVTASGLLLVLGLLAALLPVPYVVLVPGPVTDTLSTVSVTGAQSYPTSGHLYLTTVGVVPGSCDNNPTLEQALHAWFSSDEAVQPKQVICPPGQSSKAVAQQNAGEMSQSQRDAMTAALLYLKFKPDSLHLTVGSTTDGTPAAEVLQAGDEVLAVDGTAVNDPDKLRTLIGRHAPGTSLTLTIVHNGIRQNVTAKVIHDPSTQRSILGFEVDQQATFSRVDVHIGVDPNEVGGPSAGLMFTLGIVDVLTPGDLTGGRTVAGTGTIDGFGHVGPIGGIQQKIAAAAHAHASVFLAPASECTDARAVAPKSLLVVKVDTLATAVKALNTIAAGGTDIPRC